VEFKNVDLTKCFFENATGLDQTQLRGETHFDRTRKRERIADEVNFRDIPSPERKKKEKQQKIKHLAQLYRDLRKAQENAKNEPRAADFYYGEMEMRRLHSTWGARLLLTAYWAISGYGLRPFRALVTLITLICVATFIFHTYGIKDAVPVGPVARIPGFDIEVARGMGAGGTAATPEQTPTVAHVSSFEIEFERERAR